VDTRKKILTVEEALRLTGPLALVTGYFDVLRAGHIRDLDVVVQEVGPGGSKLLVVVLPDAAEYLAQRARAELVAALRMVDYVVPAGSGDAARLAETLHCAPVVSLEQADRERSRGLKEHIHGRQA